MTEFFKKVGAIAWIMFGLCFVLFVVLRIVGAATNDRWAEGCFWLLLCHMIYSADKRSET